LTAQEALSHVFFTRYGKNQSPWHLRWCYGTFIWRRTNKIQRQLVSSEDSEARDTGIQPWEFRWSLHQKKKTRRKKERKKERKKGLFGASAGRRGLLYVVTDWFVTEKCNSLLSRLRGLYVEAHVDYSRSQAAGLVYVCW
jgi:hypothetical protein